MWHTGAFHYVASYLRTHSFMLLILVSPFRFPWVLLTLWIGRQKGHLCHLSSKILFRHRRKPRCNQLTQVHLDSGNRPLKQVIQCSKLVLCNILCYILGLLDLESFQMSEMTFKVIGNGTVHVLLPSRLPLQQFLCYTIFRSTLRQSRPNKAGLKCPSVCTCVHTDGHWHPSVHKKFLWFQWNL